MLRTDARRVAAAVMLAFASACQGDTSSVVRGRGLAVAALPAADQARVYEAAARGAFDVDNTSLLLDRRLLPREPGLADSGRLGEDVVAELKRQNTIKGVCEPPLTGVVGTAGCSAEYPGYIVRYSPVFALGKDSVQVYIYSQKYDTPASGRSETLRFERAYQVAKHADGWHAVREGYVPKDVRGER